MSASAKIDLLICSRAEVGVVAVVVVVLGIKWNEYGNGSSVYHELLCSTSLQIPNHKEGCGDKTHLPPQLVHKHLQRIPPRISRKVDRRSQIRPIFGILELDNNGWDRLLGLGRCRRLDSLGVSRLLSFRRWEERRHGVCGI